MKNVIWTIGIALAALLLGSWGGYGFAERDRGVTGELRRAAERLEPHLDNSMFQMLLLAECQADLAQTELVFLEFTLNNQDNYQSIAATYHADQAQWEKSFRQQLAQLPSRDAAGSQAPLDYQVLRYQLLRQRIAELKQKFLR